MKINLHTEEVVIKMMAWDFLRQAAAYLAAHEVEESRLEAELLLAYVLDVPREALYLDRERSLSNAQAEAFWAAIVRRGQRVPYAYIVGTREFRGLPLAVDEHVLIPRPETERLVEIILEERSLWSGWDDKASEKTNHPGKRPVHLLDLCTGSGAVALAIATAWRELTRAYTDAGSRSVALAIVASDISSEALAVARTNGQRLGADVSWRLGDLWEAVPGQRFDCIAVNPPYVTEAEYAACSPEVRREPPLALLGGADGLTFYRRLAAEARTHLCAGGRLYTEIGWQQAAAVRALFAAAGLETALYQDWAGRDRVVAAW